MARANPLCRAQIGGRRLYDVSSVVLDALTAAQNCHAGTLRVRKEHRKIANAQRVGWLDALEGSRFVAWQLYRLAAGGFRERLKVRQFYGPLYPRNTTDAMGKTLRWVIRGSRLLATDRAAIL
jgi:hypothetical protein